MRTTNRELLALPQTDFLRLTAAMKAYAIDESSGYVVKSYGDRLMMIKDASHGQGRGLFFSVRVVGGEEVMTLLLVYKKESREAPARVVETARRRMQESDRGLG